MSIYPLPTYRLKERIYENSDKSIVIYRTRKKQTIKYIAVKIYSKTRQPFYDHEYSFLKNINHPSIVNVTGAAEKIKIIFIWKWSIVPVVIYLIAYGQIKVLIISKKLLKQ